MMLLWHVWLVKRNSVKQQVRMLIRVSKDDIVNLLIQVIGLFDLTSAQCSLSMHTGRNVRVKAKLAHRMCQRQNRLTSDMCLFGIILNLKVDDMYWFVEVASSC